MKINIYFIFISCVLKPGGSVLFTYEVIQTHVTSVGLLSQQRQKQSIAAICAPVFIFLRTYI